MFTYLFGGAISGNYLPLIIPGILAQSILTGAITIDVQLREDMDKGVFDRFRSFPSHVLRRFAGALLADTIRYCLVHQLDLRACRSDRNGFLLSIAGGLVILLIFIPLTVRTYMRRA
jgi:hypothetical protein